MLRKVLVLVIEGKRSNYLVETKQGKKDKLCLPLLEFSESNGIVVASAGSSELNYTFTEDLDVEEPEECDDCVMNWMLTDEMVDLQPACDFV